MCIICAKQNGGCKNITLTFNDNINELNGRYNILALYQKAFSVQFLLPLNIVHVVRYLFVLYLTNSKDFKLR